VSELVDGESREFEDATRFGVQTIFEALLNMSQRFAFFTDEAIFLVTAEYQILRSAGSSEFMIYPTSDKRNLVVLCMYSIIRALKFVNYI
jgi:hypothetical protein